MVELFKLGRVICDLAPGPDPRVKSQAAITLSRLTYWLVIGL